jgi:hypothetical protein
LVIAANPNRTLIVCKVFSGGERGKNTSFLWGEKLSAAGPEKSGPAA